MLEKEALQGEITCSIMPERTELALPVPTKSLLETSLDMDMLIAPFRCTHPPPPIPPLPANQLYF